MQQRRFPAVFMRGGTSKAIVFHRRDLPADQSEWDALFLNAIGSPDPNGRQLDGMGGGLSSLSKICVVAPSTRSDADVDYTFVQIGVTEPTVSYAMNCGNMSSAIGPFAIDEGLAKTSDPSKAVVRIFNTNTGKLIVSHFSVEGGLAAVDGDFAIDGVSGTGAPVRLDFVDPAGAKTGKLLPTGHPTDQIDVPDVGPLTVSMVDAGSACVFVDAADLGAAGSELPDAIELDGALLARLRSIRRHAAVKMGLAADEDRADRQPNVPLVAMVAAPADTVTLSGDRLKAEAMDIQVRMLSLGQPHRAVPLTGSLCLAVASRIAGTIPNRLARGGDDEIRIAHPSGRLVVGARVDTSPTGISVPYATTYRTARRLFQGEVLVRRQPPASAAAGTMQS